MYVQVQKVDRSKCTRCSHNGCRREYSRNHQGHKHERLI